jgi:glycosyltransferase involved in cell wall biosynthesis
VVTSPTPNPTEGTFSASKIFNKSSYLPPPNKELVKDKVTGFLFKNEDSEDLEKVLKLVQNSNKKDLASIKIKARAFSENYKWDKIIQKLESLISQ